MAHPSRPSRQAWLLPSLISLFALGVALPAHALDFFGGCGMGGVPVTGWNGNTDNVARTVNIKCGESRKFSVQFNARVTQGDKDAGGFIFRLVDEDAISDDLLLSATVECEKVADLAVGTELVCSAKFTLKCTDDCEVEGVSIEEIVINEMPPETDLLCTAKNPWLASERGLGRCDQEHTTASVPAPTARRCSWHADSRGTRSHETPRAHVDGTDLP